MKALNKLLMLAMMTVTLGVTTSCGGKAPDDSGDIIDRAESIGITIINGHANGNDVVKFKCNDDANDLVVDWGDGVVNNECSHTYKDYIYYTITISGHVTSLSFSDENGLYSPANDEIAEIFFSSTITTLPKYSFNITRLSNVVIPGSIKNIGEYAFNHSRYGIEFCIEFEQKPQGWADTWSNVRSFVDLAIWGVKVGISDNYIYVMGKYNGVYAATSSLYHNEATDLIVPDAVVFKDVKYLIYRVAINDSKVVTVRLPKYLKLLGGFGNCSSLTSIDYSKSLDLTGIDSYAFGDCPSLTELIIPKTIRHISKDALICKLVNLTKITVEEGNPVYYSPSNSNVVMEGDKIVTGCKTSTIPENTKIIGVNAFKDSKIEKVDIPSNVEKIDEYAFNDCTELKSITFSDQGNLQEIARYAFAYSQVETIKFPASIKHIYQDAFWESNCLKNIDVTAFTSEDKIPICDDAFDGYSSGVPVKVFTYSKSLEVSQFVNKGWPDASIDKIEWKEAE